MVTEKELEEMKARYQEISGEYLEQVRIRDNAWKKLVERGIEIARQRGLEIVVKADKNYKPADKEVVLYKTGEREADATNLIKLSQIPLHDTYITYLESKEKSEELEEKLEEMLKKF